MSSEYLLREALAEIQRLLRIEAAALAFVDAQEEQWSYKEDGTFPAEPYYALVDLLPDLETGAR